MAKGWSEGCTPRDPLLVDALLLANTRVVCVQVPPSDTTSFLNQCVVLTDEAQSAGRGAGTVIDVIEDRAERWHYPA